MGRLKRFTNRAQLVRYITQTTDMSEEEVWEKLDDKLG